MQTILLKITHIVLFRADFSYCYAAQMETDTLRAEIHPSLSSVMYIWPESRSRRDKHALWGSTWPGVKIKQQLVGVEGVIVSTYLDDGFTRAWWKPYSTLVARRHSITLILKWEVAALFISTQLFAITKAALPGSLTSVALRGLNSISLACRKKNERSRVTSTGSQQCI